MSKEPKGRVKGTIIKWMIKEKDISRALLSEYLGISKPYLDNKFFRDSFSFDDIVLTAMACDYDIILRDRDTKEDFLIDAKDYFSFNFKPEVLARVKSIEGREF